MAITTDCAEGRHEVCRGAGPNHYCSQTAHMGDQKCACRCHAARFPQGEDHKTARPEQPPPDALGGQPPAEPETP